MQGNIMDIISIFLSILSLIFSVSSFFIALRININTKKINQKNSTVMGDQIGGNKNVK